MPYTLYNGCKYNHAAMRPKNDPNPSLQLAIAVHHVAQRMVVVADDIPGSITSEN